MESVSRDVRAMEPVIVQCAGGSWMALSPSRAPLHIGVAGPTPDLARAMYATAKELWALLLDTVPS